MEFPCSIEPPVAQEREGGAAGYVLSVIRREFIRLLIFFFLYHYIDRYCETLIRPDVRRTTRTERVAYVFCFFIILLIVKSRICLPVFVLAHLIY